MPFAPLERKAAFMAAVTMKETTKTAAAEELDVSWTHLDAVLLGEREGSAELKEKVADYVGVPVDDFWRAPETAQAN
jgi:hypothetical protein